MGSTGSIKIAATRPGITHSSAQSEVGCPDSIVCVTATRDRS